MEESLPFHPDFDCHGLLAKTTEDIAAMLSVMLGGRDVSGSLNSSWVGMRVGFVDPVIWQMGPSEIKPNEDFSQQSVRMLKQLL